VKVKVRSTDTGKNFLYLL